MKEIRSPSAPSPPRLHWIWRKWFEMECLGTIIWLADDTGTICTRKRSCIAKLLAAMYKFYCGSLKLVLYKEGSRFFSLLTWLLFPQGKSFTESRLLSVSPSHHCTPVNDAFQWCEPANLHRSAYFIGPCIMNLFRRPISFPTSERSSLVDLGWESYGSQRTPEPIMAAWTELQTI